MRCDRCGRDAILRQRYSGLRLCGEHFRSALEARAKQTIRTRGWIWTGDRIAICLSGGTGSSSLLHFLVSCFGVRRDLRFVAITVDEGNGMNMGRIRAMAEGRGIAWAGTSLDGESRDGDRVPVDASSPARRTGLRDRALARLAGEAGATKLAMGTSLDAMAVSMFLKVLAGDGAGLVREPGQGEHGIPRIEPFNRIPAEELSLYARLNSLDAVPGHGRDGPDALETEAGRILREYTIRHPSAMFSLANLAEALLATGSGVRSRDSPPRRWREEQISRTGQTGNRGGNHG